MLLRTLLGLSLRDLRRERGLTLQDVADRAHVSVSHLSEIERGIVEASSELLAAICAALEIEIGGLLQLVLSRWGITSLDSDRFTLAA